LLVESTGKPADLRQADRSRDAGKASGGRILGLLEQPAEAGLELGTGIGFGKEAIGELLRPPELPRGQRRSHRASSSESTFGMGGGKKLRHLLLKERDVKVSCLHAWGVKILESLGAPNRVRNQRVKKFEAHGSMLSPS